MADNTTQEIKIFFLTNADAVGADIAELTTQFKSNEEAYNKLTLEAKKLELAEIDLLNAQEKLNDSTAKTEKQQLALEKAVVKAQAALERQVNASANVVQKFQSVQSGLATSVSGFNSLSNSVNQLGRELPNFAQSAEIGIRSISNNIGPLVDAFDQIRSRGGTTRDVFKELGKAIFSWNTAISVATTLLVVYGKEIADWLTTLIKGEKVINQATMAAEQFNKALDSPEVVSAITNVSRLKDEIELAKEGYLDKDDVLKDYNTTFGKTLGYTKDINEAERQLVENGDDFIQMTLFKTAAQQAYEESAKALLEAQKKNIEADEQAVQHAKDLASANSNALKSFVLQITGLGNVGAANAVFQEQTTKGQAKQLNERSNTLLKIAEDFNKKAAELAKVHGWNLLGNDDAPKKDKKTPVDHTVENMEKGLEKLKKINDEMLAVSMATDGTVEKMQQAIDKGFQNRLKIEEKYAEEHFRGVQKIYADAFKERNQLEDVLGKASFDRNKERINDIEKTINAEIDARESDLLSLATSEEEKTRISKAADDLRAANREEANRKREEDEIALQIKITDAIGEGLQKASEIADIFSGLDEVRKNKELARANGDAEEIERINRKYFEKEKKGKIVAATLSGLMSITDAYAAGVKAASSFGVTAIAAPAWGAAYAAIAAVTTGVQIAKIKSVQYDSTGGGTGGGGGGGAIPATAQPNVSFIASSENQLADTINTGTRTQTNRLIDTPVKAFVVSSDVTSAQELDRKLLNSTTIG